MGDRRAAAAVSAIALAVALPAAVACEQALSIDGPVTIAAHDACGVPVSPGACQSCLAAKCCSQATACAADKGCTSYESCTLGCGADYVCRTSCAVATTQSQGGIAAFDQCVATQCSDACQETCGLPAVPTAPDAAASCVTCMGNYTCSQAQQCTQDLACEQLSHCLAGCFTLDCHQACLSAYDGGAFTNLEVGLIGHCLKPCELGQLWICLGNEPSPTLPPGESDVTFTFADSTSNKPLAGVQINACGPSDPDCNPAVTSGTTDAQGSATLTFPTHGGVGLGFRGYFELLPPASEAGDASTDELPQMYVAAQNFSIPHAHLGWVGFTQSALAAEASVPGVKLDPMRGELVLQAYDCLQAPASGVTFQVTGTDGASSPVLYWNAGAFGAGGATTIIGLGGVFNVPPGPVEVVATPTVAGRPSSKVTAFVRAGWITAIAMAPTE